MGTRTGLHRLFVLVCIGWAAAVLLAYPMVEVRDTQNFLANMREFYRTEHMSMDQKDALVREMEKKTTIQGYYRNQMLPNWYAVIAGIVIPLAVFYGVARGIIATGRWVVTGFQRRS